MKQYNSTTLVRTIWSLLLVLSALCLISPTAEAQTTPQGSGGFEIVYPTGGWGTLRGRDALKGAPKPTGTLNITFQPSSQGTPPYKFEILDRPDGYEGPMVLTSNTNPSIIYNLPAGDYVLNVSDATGYTKKTKGLVKETTVLQFFPEPFTQKFTPSDHFGWVASVLNVGGKGYYTDDVETLNQYFEYAICTQGEYRKYEKGEGTLNWMSLNDTGEKPTFTGNFGVWHVQVPEVNVRGDTIMVDKPCLFIKLPKDGPTVNKMYAKCAFAPAYSNMLSIAMRVKGTDDPKYSNFANHFYGGFEGAQTFDPNNWLEVIGGAPSPCFEYKPTIRIKEEWAKKLTFPVTISVRNLDDRSFSAPEMLYMTFTEKDYMIPQEFKGGHMSPGHWNRIYMTDSSGRDSSLGLKPNDTSGEPVIPGYCPDVHYRDTDTTRMWNEFSGWHPDLEDGKIGRDYCEGTVDKVLAIAVQEKRWGRAYKSVLAGAEFTLVKAPEGYEEYRKKYKYFPELNKPLVLPEKHQSDWFYPFASNEAPADNPYMDPCFDVKVPEGEYYWRIKFIDLCGDEKTLPTPTTEKLGPLKTSIYYNDAIKYELENKGENLKPQIEKISCNQVRVYPFRGAKSRDILWRTTGEGKNNVKESVPVYARAVQTYVDEYGHTKYIDEGTISFDPTDPNQNPEDRYILLPWRNSTVEIQYNYENKFRFTKIIPCLDLGMKLTIETTAPTYDRDQLYTYICPSRQTAYVSVLPIHTAGETLVELRDVKDATKVYAKETIASKDQGKSVSFDLTGDQVKPEYSLYIRTGSDDCLLDNGGEIIKMSDLSGSSFILGAAYTKYCEGDIVKIECPPIRPESKYIWTEPDGKTKHEGRKITIPNATRAISGKWKLEVTEVPCDGTPATQEVPFILSVAPPELWWRKEAKSADWNSLDNWADKEGKPANAIPAKCTDVHLPAVVDNSYPNLDPKKTIREPLGEPVCNDIYFHFGSALGQPHLLTHYSRAFIDYNFGIVQSDGKIKAYEDPNHPKAYDRLLERDRWYMMATPLKNVYAGDFSLGAHPLTYQRYLKVKHFGERPKEASFDKPITKQGRSMVAYNHALAYKVEGYHPEKLGAKDHTNLNGLQGIIRLPYYENKERAPYYPLHHYSKTIDRYRFDESTQKWVLVGSVVDPHSYFAYFDMKDLRPLTRVDSVKRDPVLDYRFLFEDDKTNAIGEVKLYNGKLEPGYTMKLTSSSKDSLFVMIGNPYMSPISIQKFFQHNTRDIEQDVYIFEKGAWKSYWGTGFSKKDSKLKAIAPLQAFVVQLKNKDVSEINFPIRVLQDPNSKYGKNAKLRSADEDEESDEITERYVAVTVTDAQGGYTSAVLLPEDTEKSTPALMAPEGMQTAPLVYFISPIDSTCNFVQTNVDRAVVELGVFAPTDGMLTLDFTTLAEKPFDKLALYDRLRGTEQDLLVNSTYSYGYSERDGRRFELRMSYGNVRYDEQQDHQPELAIERTATGYRISYDQGIAGYQLYSVQGYLLERATTDGQTQVEIEMPETDVVLLDVQSADGLRWIKKLQR